MVMAAMKIMEMETSAMQEKLLEGMGRMAVEPSVRGIMIQQGCLSACLKLDKWGSKIECTNSFYFELCTNHSIWLILNCSFTYP